ncbi:hypothetical protein MNEG_0675 [Monoraphidium neglectum]|uniref:EGF-like domain-containing protein n=1 Tax=Monoraphidium neglectum TaxID=145388 RepID=A0A0D2MXS6_9CHLO|nr:hypothetical protein MNEG_0675 [Monoraphidium neglectum]KIZ07280.1 hypothetical protein MNEG_0675 [Monoraphidium neglectum]|eukprot:XP_013906299.1 hypothetical protein MNEG_0675 [Monoraphidium neglectum]
MARHPTATAVAMAVLLLAAPIAAASVDAQRNGRELQQLPGLGGLTSGLTGGTGGSLLGGALNTVGNVLGTVTGVASGVTGGTTTTNPVGGLLGGLLGSSGSLLGGSGGLLGGVLGGSNSTGLLSGVLGTVTGLLGSNPTGLLSTLSGVTGGSLLGGLTGTSGATGGLLSGLTGGLAGGLVGGVTDVLGNILSGSTSGLLSGTVGGLPLVGGLFGSKSGLPVVGGLFNSTQLSGLPVVGSLLGNVPVLGNGGLLTNLLGLASGDLLGGGGLNAVLNGVLNNAVGPVLETAAGLLPGVTNAVPLVTNLLGGNQSFILAPTDVSFIGGKGALLSSVLSLNPNALLSVVGITKLPDIGNITVGIDGSFLYNGPNLNGSTSVCIQVTDLLSTAPICIDLIRNLQIPAVGGILPLVFSNKTVIDLKGGTNFTGNLLSGVVSPNLNLGGILSVAGLGLLPDVGTININKDGTFTFDGILNGTTMFCAVVTDTLSTLPLCQTISNLLPALPSIPLPVCLPGCLNGVCTPGLCKNGGVCTSNNTCNCDRTGFTGPTCTGPPPVCNPTCQNGGACINTNKCACLPGFAGPVCNSTTTVPPPGTTPDATFVCPRDGVCKIAAPGVLKAAPGPNGFVVVSTSKPGVGTVGVTSDGAITFTPPLGFAGNTTFVSLVTNGTLAKNLLIQLSVTDPAPPAPTAGDDTFNCPFNADCVIAAPGVLANDATTNPGGKVVVVSNTGNVTVTPAGAITLKLIPGFAGDVVFNYTINDGVSIKPVTAKVTLVVPGSDTAGGVTAVANSFLLLVPADGTANNARCPDPTPGLAEIVNAAVAKIKTVAGLTSVNGAFSRCDLLDQGKVLVTIIYTITAPTAAPINTALAGINSPPVVGTAAAGDNICTSSLLGSLCNGTVFTGLRVTDGCATTAQQTTKLPKFNVTHIPANYPFSVGFAAKVCVPKPSRSNPLRCTNKFLTAGAATATCNNGTLGLEFESVQRFVIGRQHTVVATCSKSRFNDISSCATPSDSTVTPTLSGGVKITNKDFDAGCVCRSTGRKPVLNLITTDVLVGQQCLA